MSTPNDAVAAMFKELVQLTLLDEGGPNSFRVRAYENAMHEIKGYRGDISTLSEKELTGIDGIGKSSAKKIREFFDTGAIAKVTDLRKKYPPEYVELSKIPGLGPKTLARLRSELGIENLEGLRAAIDEHRLRELRGLGQKMEEKLSKAIDRLGLTGKDKRTPIAEALPVARQLIEALEALPEVVRAQYCGSLRRFRETVADIDIVVASTEPTPVMDHVVGLPLVSDVIGHGETKTSVLTASGLQIDVRVVEPNQFGAACQYFTGSKAHNIKLRQLAIKQNWLLNEYGLIDNESGDVVASETEDAIYEALGLPYIPPPMREDRGEIESAAEATLRPAIRLNEMKGDLHVHTDLSGDGRSPLEDVLSHASARGYSYLAITDHAENLGLNGVSREQLREQRAAIDALRGRFPDMTVLHGSELNIGSDGGLDYDEDFRRELEWCVAAVHSHFDLDRAQQTKRVVAAMEDPTVHVIGHLTGRMIGKRPGIELDIDAVLEKAVETGTAIEINAGLPRLDAAAEVLHRARDLDVTFVISTDTHHVRDLDRMEWGVLHATRGWVDTARIANTWPKARFLEWVAERRR